jgi:uncharacterized protein
MKLYLNDMRTGAMIKFSLQNPRATLGKTLLMAAAFGLAVPAAYAQFSDSYKFLKAVTERKGQEATTMIEEPGSGAVIINTRDDKTGRTALHIVIDRRDADWTHFLLHKGANPGVTDKKSVTPLILATQLGFVEGAELLLQYKADVDQTNRSGETPLILATQLRNAEMVRLLLKNGASADKTDNVAGLSARDYAARDGRESKILPLIEANDAAKKLAPKKGGGLDFSGIGAVK